MCRQEDVGFKEIRNILDCRNQGSRPFGFWNETTQAVKRTNRPGTRRKKHSTASAPLRLGKVLSNQTGEPKKENDPSTWLKISNTEWGA